MPRVDVRRCWKVGSQNSLNQTRQSGHPSSKRMTGSYLRSACAASILNHRCMVSMRTAKVLSLTFRPVTHWKRSHSMP